jgi:hypothetical protein
MPTLIASAACADLEIKDAGNALATAAAALALMNCRLPIVFAILHPHRKM